MLIWDAGTEVTGKQGDYNDPLFTYREGDEASYFISDEPEGRATGVGPSGAGEGRESPMASSSRGLVSEHVASARFKENRVPPQLLRLSGLMNVFLSQPLVIWQKPVLL